jgi:hypothetical protein
MLTRTWRWQQCVRVHLAEQRCPCCCRRCQEQTRRLELRLRAKEGRGGTVQAFVIPNSQSHSCAAIGHRIKPLCLHQRSQSLDPSRPCSMLTITGESRCCDAAHSSGTPVQG